MRCPSCESENVRRLSAVWEEGSYSETTVARSSTKGSSDVWGGGQMGYAQTRQSGTTRSTTTGMTALAERARPPELVRPFFDGMRLLGMGAGGIFLGGLIIAAATSDPVAFTLMAAASAWLVWYVVNRARRGLAFNRNDYPSLRERWERSWWCAKCGEIYE